MPVWMNADGLPVQLGMSESDLGRVATYRTHGPRRFVEVVLDAGFFPDATADTEVYNWANRLPVGALIEEVVVGDTREDFAGAGTVSLGLVNTDGTTDGVPAALVDAATSAELNTVGESAAVEGSAVGTILDSIKMITITRAGAAFTAGIGTIRVYYSIPKLSQSGDSLVYDKATT